MKRILDDADILTSFGNSETAVMSQKAVTANAKSIVDNFHNTNDISNHVFALGRIVGDGGGNADATNRVRVALMQTTNAMVEVPENKRVAIYWYGESGYLGYEKFSDDTVRFTNIPQMPEGAVYCKLMFGFADNSDIVDVDAFTSDIKITYLGDKVSLYFTAGNVLADGTENTDVRYIISKLVPKRDAYVRITEGIKFKVACYNKDGQFLRVTDFYSTSEFMNDIIGNDVSFVKYILDAGKYVGDANDRMLIVATKIGIYYSTSKEYVSALLEKCKAMGLEIASLQNEVSKNNEEIVILQNKIAKNLIEFTPKFFAGGLQSADGSDNKLAKRIRSEYIDTIDAQISMSTDVKVSIFFYGENGYISSSGFITDKTEYNVKDYAPDGAVRFRLIGAHVSDGPIAKIDDVASHIKVRILNSDNAYASDVPQNNGALNAILNIKQMAEIRYDPKRNIPQQNGDLDANVEQTGIPYSSTRPESLFVPNNVSFHTYMTAVQNPNSYLYTVDLGELGNENGHTYYGAVCSTTAGYALGIVPNYSTHQWTEIDGMELIEPQSVYNLALCDTIVGNGHVVTVTDIKRNKRGKVCFITITEAISPVVRSTDYTPEQLVERFPASTNKYCRYKKLCDVKHMQSPFVAVEDEKPQSVVYNTAIIPRKGDKANWLVGTDVEIDVLEQGTYTAVEIYKDGAPYTTKSIASVITLSGLGYGSYKARLTDGTSTSDWCYWMMVDAVSTATPTGADGKVNVTFSAHNATPLWVQWANGTHNGTVYVNEISAAEASAGSATVAHTAGSFKVRVAFKTEYGIIHSALPDAIAVQ